MGRDTDDNKVDLPLLQVMSSLFSPKHPPALQAFVANAVANTVCARNPVISILGCPSQKGERRCHGS
eukprot:SAG11_NODE_404_length_9736_cov_20.243022_14_plen_67_part_00